ncbi:hypothetical protein GCM10023321_26080 [Pseudonocardia eucalypti]|uniref:Uncharacterized protein n=1 Tax=Pseudonocardia eucalypti TaxID=648755 RepID=A0ABP9Q3W6_9PSEU|nr:hypothetical protein [Pseudonocardia eucalypti]
MSSDTQFTALGPTAIGFQTHGANIKTGADASGTEDGVRGSCGAGLGENGAGVRATSSAPNGNGVIAVANNGTNAFGIWAIARRGFAGNFDGRVQVNGSLQVNGALTVTGAKSAAVRVRDGSLRLLYAVESPESWFEDFGVGALENGYATVELDSDFSSVLADETYHVFLTEYDDNNALYVAARTGTSFEVRSKNASAKSQFSYRIVGKRRDIPAERFAVAPDEPAQKELIDVSTNGQVAD